MSIANYFMALVFLSVLAAWPAAARAQSEGECASGFCGTPANNGGGCGCCGGSILVANTDIGDTYSTSDDYDADGFEDDFDNCPFTANRDQADSDADGFGNGCDNAPDASNQDQRDTDGDGLGDAADTDADGDGLLNTADNCSFVPNLAQTATDSDSLGDACDGDDDADGVLDSLDNCPLVANPDQSDSAPNTYGDACDNDSDVDNISDSVDNCAMAYNVDQKDIDADGWGDACDLDLDADEQPNNYDNCPAVANREQADADHDGNGDSCDQTFCFVAALNRDAECLDPNSVFQVTAAPRVTATTGEKIRLLIYANREDTAMQYTWTITSRPSGSSTTVRNPMGAVSQSELYQYQYQNADREPNFMPDQAGTYEVTVAADLEQPDSIFADAVHSQSTVTIVVTGDPIDAGGCGVVPGGRSAPAWILFLLVGLLPVVRRRNSR